MSVEQTRLIRRIVAEHASRIIFANEEDREVPLLRPRVVDAKAVKSEQEQWENWHEQQLAAEKDIMGQSHS